MAKSLATLVSIVKSHGPRLSYSDLLFLSCEELTEKQFKKALRLAVQARLIRIVKHDGKYYVTV